MVRGGLRKQDDPPRLGELFEVRKTDRGEGCGDTTPRAVRFVVKIRYPPCGDSEPRRRTRRGGHEVPNVTHGGERSRRGQHGRRKWPERVQRATQRFRSLPEHAFAGKIVIDATNSYPERDGTLNFGSMTSSEVVARYLKGARMVKAFTTMRHTTLNTRAQPGHPLEERLALYMAGDERNAKAAVAHLIESIGFASFDTGSLYDGGPL